MGADTTISIAFILSLISCLGVIVSMVSTFKKDNDARTKEKLDIEKNFVKINVKLDNFCDTIRTVLKNQEKSNDELNELSQQIVKSNERIETLFHYHDDHDERLKKLEDKTK